MSRKELYRHPDMEHWAEEYECGMLYLDDINIPRRDKTVDLPEGIYSIVGRIKLLQAQREDERQMRQELAKEFVQLQREDKKPEIRTCYGLPHSGCGSPANTYDSRQGWLCWECKKIIVDMFGSDIGERPKSGEWV